MSKIYPEFPIHNTKCGYYTVEIYDDEDVIIKPDEVEDLWFTITQLEKLVKEAKEYICLRKELKDV